MNVKELFKNDRFAEQLGIKILEAENGHSKLVLATNESHLNGANIVQGGVIFTLADTALAAAANSHGNIAVTISANISFLHPSKPGLLTAEAVEISKTNRLASYTVSVYDSEAVLVALVSGTAYRKAEKF